MINAVQILPLPSLKTIKMGRDLIQYMEIYSSSE